MKSPIERLIDARDQIQLAIEELAPTKDPISAMTTLNTGKNAGPLNTGSTPESNTPSQPPTGSPKPGPGGERR